PGSWWSPQWGSGSPWRPTWRSPCRRRPSRPAAWCRWPASLLWWRVKASGCTPSAPGPIFHLRGGAPPRSAPGRVGSVPANSAPVVYRVAGDGARDMPGHGQLALAGGRDPGGARVRVPDPGRGARAGGGAGRGVPSLQAPDQADHSLHCVSVGTLYLVSTPIGNLDDITLRALQVLEAAPLVAAEDTRHTLKLLTHFGLRRPLVSLHAHNEERQLESILE